MNVVFFTQDRWAFGNIHHSLARVLYPYGIHAELVDFSVSHKLDEMELLDEWADLFITNPDAVPALMTYNIPYYKIAIVAHAEWDILRAMHTQDKNVFYKVKKYGVISNHLVKRSKDFGITRVPDLLEIGIITDKYELPLPRRLETIGYAGAFSTVNFEGKEIKRGYLVERVIEKCRNANLSVDYVPHNFYKWQAMPSYYKKIDLLLVTSTEEGAGLPILEAMAAGRGVFTTNVGYAQDIPNIITIPQEEDLYVQQCFKLINHYYYNPKLYLEYCNECKRQSYYYDWHHRVKAWVDFILKK